MAGARFGCLQSADLSVRPVIVHGYNWRMMSCGTHLKQVKFTLHAIHKHDNEWSSLVQPNESCIVRADVWTDSNMEIDFS